MAKSPSKEPRDMARGRRIWAIRKHFAAGSQEQFADTINSSRVGVPVSRGAVGNWELGKGIKPDNVRSICATFDVSADWIWTGENPPKWFTQFFVDGKFSGDGPRDEKDDFDRLLDLEPTIIPIHEAERNGHSANAAEPAFGSAGVTRKISGSILEADVRPGAGQGAIGEVVSFAIGSETYSAHAVTGEWVIPPGTLEHHLRLDAARSLVLRITGDSMEPTFRSGDPVVVDLRVTEFGDDGIYVFSEFGEAPRIKRLQRVIGVRPKRVRIISDNPAYREDEIDADALIIHGRVGAVVVPK